MTMNGIANGREAKIVGLPLDVQILLYTFERKPSLRVYQYYG
jgi:hypothetical protein